MAIAGTRVGGAVREVTAGSLAARIGLRPGDKLLSVDGHALRDAIDVAFYAAEERFRLTFERDGREQRSRRSGVLAKPWASSSSRPSSTASAPATMTAFSAF